MRVIVSSRAPAMPIQLDYKVSRQRFHEALELARSSKVLPQEWLDRVRRVQVSGSRSFMAMLGTALLGKATDPTVDAFSLKARGEPNAYNARSLSERVLLPCCGEAGVRLPTSGPQPLNNQPFFRSERVSRDMQVRSDRRGDLDHLCDCLASVDQLGAAQAVEVLAAFLRVGRDVPAPVALKLAERHIELPELIEQTTAFVTKNSEGGKRGQALVAACFSLAFEDVNTRKINDPGRRWPGDVAVGRGKVMSLAAEVKQRPVGEQETLQLAARCEAKGCRRAMMVMLDPAQPPIAEGPLHVKAWERYGVHLTLVGGVPQLMITALSWSPMPFEEAVAKFPRLMLERLQQLEASPEGIHTWVSLFQDKA